MPEFRADEPNAVAAAGVATGTNSIGLRGDGVFAGVFGASVSGEGVHAHTESDKSPALAAFNINPGSDRAAIFAKKDGEKGHAGFFDGNVHITRSLFVTGDVTLPNADFAEDFHVADAAAADPGTVMVLSDEEALQPSNKPYDKRVAGVVSGAGAYKPGIVLDKHPGATDRLPIALLGKAYCKVDASYGPVEVGDLLTTSPSVGYAMKVIDSYSAFGSVIGKALRALPSGQALIPVFITLQ
ncbi:hypothetical protein [Streptomyces sp. NPDC101206]|uniref:hypothetical protein n=1 Tax=Streptomyces sp. NPDC101206 TaxID=3366128 RepID=UPI00380100F4